MCFNTIGYYLEIFEFRRLDLVKRCKKYGALFDLSYFLFFLPPFLPSLATLSHPVLSVLFIFTSSVTFLPVIRSHTQGQRAHKRNKKIGGKRCN